MKKTGALLLILFVFAAASNLKAQKQWTLQECINYAIQNNIQLKRQELQSQIARNDYRQSKAEILPNLGANASHNWNFGRSIDRFTNQILTSTVVSDNFSLQSSVLLFAGFQIRNTIEQNKYILEKSLQDYEKARNDMSIQIATVYLQILFSEEALEVAENQLEVTRLQVEKTKRLVEVGNKAKGELLQMQTQEANERYNLTNAKNNLNISYLTLTQMLELKSNENFKIFHPDTILLDNLNILSNVDDIYAEAMNKLPDVKSSEYALKSAEKGLSIARGQYYPTLNLSAAYYTGYSDARKKIRIGEGYDTTTIGYVNSNPLMPVTYYSPNTNNVNYPFFEQLKDNNSKSLSFGMSIPIFNRFQTRKNVSNAKIRVIDAKYYVEQVKKDLYKEIQKAHADATAALDKYNSANEAVVSNEESFKYFQQKYDVGMVSSIDYNIAKNDLIKAKSDLIQAKYEYIFKVKVLDFYKGNPLTL